MEDMGITIGVLGLGFVGLTTAAGFVAKGFSVTSFEIDDERRNTLKSGVVPFHEPGVDVVGVHITDCQDKATKNADVIFLCVGTPQGGNGAVDLSYIRQALSSLKAKENCVIVIKSTVPPGTTTLLQEEYPHLTLANNPEFLREGYAWEDFINPDRIVCGVADEKSKQLLKQIYEPFNVPIHFTSLNTAEFIKYLSNTMLATMISYANEMSIIADNIGSINIKKAFDILHEDNRLMGSGVSNYIYPGAGYGGYCLPKDTKAMAYVGGKHANILNKVIATNENMTHINLEKITKQCKSKNTEITILGLSFKPNSDDVRDSTAAKIIASLLEQGYTNIRAYDPLAIQAFRQQYNFDINYIDNLDHLLSNKQELNDTVFVIATAWEEFKNIDYSNTKLIDLRYII